MTIIQVLVVVAVSVAAHELAHALAARLLGFRIFEVWIGAGPALRRRIGETDLALAVIPLGGHVVAGGRPGPGFARRAAAVAGAGALANLALAAVGAIIGSSLLVVFNLVAAASNLWPGVRSAVGATASDGRVVFDLVRGDEHRLLEEQSTWWAVPARRAVDADDLDTASHLVEEGIAAIGPARSLRSIRAAVAFRQRRFAAAVDDFAVLIGDEALSETVRGRVAADAAWSASLSGDPSLAGLALPWADFARRLAPRDPRRRVVHALALVDAGRPDAALAALPDLPGDPSVAAVASLAHLDRGDANALATSVAAMTDVDGLAPDHPLRQRVEAALGRGRS